MNLAIVYPSTPVPSQYMPGGAGLWFTFDKTNDQRQTLYRRGDGGEHTYKGSFCPWKNSTDTWHFKWNGTATGDGTIKLQIAISDENENGNNWKDSGQLNGDKLQIEVNNRKMYYGKCYKILLWRKKNFNTYPEHWLHVNPDDEPNVWYGDPHSVAGNFGDECLINKNRYGTTCQSISTVDCNGVISLGILGNGQCTCSDYKADPFCAEPIYPGLLQYSLYESPSETNWVTFETFNTSDSITSPPYHRAVITGRITLPQVSDYQFRIVNSPYPVNLTIGSHTVSSGGTFQDCTKSHTTPVITLSMTSSKTSLDISIRLNTGCPFAGPEFDMSLLEWKFMAKAVALQNEPEWEPVPKGYFGL